MSKVSYIPDGYHTATPYLIVNGAAAALNYYTKAFGATETFRMPGPDGKIGHCEFKIGNSIFMASEVSSALVRALTSASRDPSTTTAPPHIRRPFGVRLLDARSHRAPSRLRVSADDAVGAGGRARRRHRVDRR